MGSAQAKTPSGRRTVTLPLEALLYTSQGTLSLLRLMSTYFLSSCSGHSRRTTLISILIGFMCLCQVKVSVCMMCDVALSRASECPGLFGAEILGDCRRALFLTTPSHASHFEPWRRHLRLNMICFRNYSSPTISLSSLRRPLVNFTQSAQASI